jgi:hypothetical protein
MAATRCARTAFLSRAVLHVVERARRLSAGLITSPIITSPQRCTNQSIQMVSDDILALIGSRFPKLRDLELGRVMVTGDWSFCFRAFFNKKLGCNNRS